MQILAKPRPAKLFLTYSFTIKIVYFSTMFWDSFWSVSSASSHFSLLWDLVHFAILSMRSSSDKQLEVLHNLGRVLFKCFRKFLNVKLFVIFVSFRRFVIVTAFLPMKNQLGEAWSYLILFVAPVAVSLVYLYFSLPETKNKNPFEVRIPTIFHEHIIMIFRWKKLSKTCLNSLFVEEVVVFMTENNPSKWS